MHEGPTEISRRIYNLLIGSGKQPATPTIEQLAYTLGISASALYKKAEGQNPFHVDEFVRLYMITNGELLPVLKYMLEQCESRKILVDIVDDGDTNGDLRDEIVDVTVEMGKLSGIVREAIDDNKISRDEATEIRQQVAEMMSILNRLLAETQIKEG